MKKDSEHIPGYTYGTAEVARSPVSMRELGNLKMAADPDMGIAIGYCGDIYEAQ